MQNTHSAEIVIFPATPQRRGFAEGDAVWYRLAEEARLSGAEWAPGRVTGFDARRDWTRIELDHSHLTVWIEAQQLRPRRPGEIQPGLQGFGL